MDVFHYLQNSLKIRLVRLEVLELSGTAEIKKKNLPKSNAKRL